MHKSKPPEPSNAHSREIVYSTRIISSAAGHSLEYVSETVETILGYKPEELSGKSEAWMKAVHPGSRDEVEKNWRDVCKSGKPSVLEYRMRFAGSRRYVWLEDRVEPRFGRDGKVIGVAGSAVDISSRKSARKKSSAGDGVNNALRLNKVLRMLSDVNQKILHESGRTSLFGGVCKLIVEEGNYRFAWIGLIDGGRQNVKPLVWEGDGHEYLIGKVIGLTDDPGKPSLVREAVGSGKAVISNDLGSKSAPALWRAEALERGYRSVGFFPMHVRGVVVGILGVYSNEPDAFQPEETGLLSELSDDIGFALWAIEARDQQEAANEVIRDREFWLNESQRIARIGSYIYTIDNQTWTGSTVLDELLGIDISYPRHFKSWLNLIHPEDRSALVSMIRESSRSGKQITSEFRILRDNDREVRWMWATGKMQPTPDGKSAVLFGTMQDITDRKKMEDDLQKERILLRTLVDNLPNSIYAKDVNYRKTLSNPTNVRHAGKRTQGEVLGKNDFDLYPRDVAEGFYDDDRKVIEKGERIIDREEFTVADDGQKRWQLTSKIPLLDVDGTVVGLVGIGTDITERKMAEEEKQRERTLLRTLLDTLPTSVWVKDAEFKRTAVNRAHVLRTRLFTGRNDLTEKDFIGKTDFDIYGEAKAREYQAEDEAVLREGKPVLAREEMVYDSEGERHWQLVSKVPLWNEGGDVSGLVGIVTDITRQKESEEAFARGRELLRTIIDSLPASIWAKDTKYRKILVNKGHVERLSLFSTLREIRTQEDLLGTTDFDMYPEQTALLYNREDRDVIENGRSIIDREEMLVDKKGNKHWQLVSKVPLLDEHGTARGLIGLVWDITKQKEVEEAHAQGRQLLRTIIDNIPNGIFVKDRNSKKIIANPAHLRGVEFSSGRQNLSEPDVVGKTDSQIYTQQMAAEFRTEDEKVLKEGLRVINREQHSVDPDGSERWEQITKIPLRDEEGGISGFVGITNDITEQKRAVEELRRERIMLKTIIDHIPNAIFAKDLHHRKILVNPSHLQRVSELVGPRTEADIIGKTDFEIFPPDVAEQRDGEDAKVIGEGSAILNQPHSELDPDGRKRWELVSKIPLRDERSSIIGMVGVSNDITALREAEEKMAESEAKFRLLAENAKDIVFRYSFVPAPHFEYVSPSCVEINGYTPEEHYAMPDLIVEIVHPDDRPMFEKQAEASLHSETPLTIRWIRKDGAVIWVEIKSRAQLDEKGRVLSFEGIVRNVTERKRSEEELRASQETLARITGSITDIIYSVNGVTGNFEYLSPAFRRILGYTAADIESRGGRWAFLKNVIEDSDQTEADPVTTWLQEESRSWSPTWERWWKCKDGSRRYIEDNSVPVYENGKLVRIDGVLRDITERKLAEEEAESERILLRTLIDNFPHSIYVKDRNYRKVIANLVDVQLFAGASSETELLGKTDFDIYPKEIAEKFFEDDRKVIEKGESILAKEEPVIDSHGVERWLLTTKVPLRGKDGAINGLVGVGVDVTEKRVIDEALKRSEAELRALFESMHDVVMVIDSEGRYLKVAPTDPSLLYRPIEEMVGKTMFDILPPELAEQLFLVVEDTLRTRRTHNFEYMLEIHGEEKWRAASISLMGEDSVIWVARDITERKIMEKEITDSEKKYRELVENALVGIFKVNLSGTIIYVNKAMSDMLEFDSPDELMSVRFSAIYKDLNDMSELVRELRESGKTGENKEIELVTKNGKVRNILISASLDTDVISGMAKDITDIRTLERQFIQTQKLEGLGNIAAGIAHDFNNILGVILGYSDLLADADYDQGKFQRGMQAIAKSADRGKSLVRQLLTFARKTEVTFESLNLNDSVVEIEKLMRETFPRTIEVRTGMAPHLPPVLADATQVHQVLLNICVNARDAMPKGGTLSISTEVVPGTLLLEEHQAATSDEYVEIRISDTGSGMDAAVRQKLFEPFFTTKGIGKGTGLGLSVVYGIVESHRGIIDVESEPDKGTTFRIYLPVLTHPIDEEELGKDVAERVQAGTGTILVVEDEEMLRELLRSVLTSRGHDVIFASNGEEGVRLFTENSARLDAVITDLGLPKLSGEEVVARISKSYDSKRIVVASGFIAPEIKNELEAKGVTHFILKPYRTSEVLKVVSEILVSAKE